jgi:hypothetical protein
MQKVSMIHTELDQIHYSPQPGRAGQGTLASAAGDTEYLDFTGRHMQNFFDCVRSRRETNCPFETGFRAAIACQVAIASYRLQSPVRWDPATEEIV